MMAIGGSVDDGPFQDIVALDFPSGLPWIQIQSISTSGAPTTISRYQIQWKGSDLSFFASSDICKAYDDSLSLIETVNRKTGPSYISATTYPGSTNACFVANSISVPDGYSTILFGDGSLTVPGTANSVGKLEIYDSSETTLKHTLTPAVFCGTTLDDKYYKNSGY